MTEAVSLVLRTTTILPETADLVLHAIRSDPEIWDYPRRLQDAFHLNLALAEWTWPNFDLWAARFAEIGCFPRGWQVDSSLAKRIERRFARDSDQSVEKPTHRTGVDPDRRFNTQQPGAR